MQFFRILRSLLSISAGFFFTAGASAFILNPSFESGLSNWSSSGNTIIVGPTQGNAPFGVQGSHIAELGAYAQAGGAVWQTLTLPTATNYQLSFYLGALADSAGIEGKVQVLVSNSIVGLVANQEFTAVSPGGPGSNGFTLKSLQFNTVSGQTSYLLAVVDTSTNPSIVDPLLDHFQLVTGTAGTNPVPVAGQTILSNGGFEFALQGWSAAGVSIYGPPDFTRIGTEGTNVAGLGGGDAANAFLQQSFSGDGIYQLQLDIAAMGPAGSRSVTRVEVLNDTGLPLLSETITNFGNGLVPFGSPPFQNLTYQFTLGERSTNAQLRFSDLSPNSGIGIDALLDRVRLVRVAGLLQVAWYPGLTVSGSVGSQHRIDFLNSLSGSPAAWQVWTNLTLTNTSATVIDLTSPQPAQRFYRSLLLP